MTTGPLVECRGLRLAYGPRVVLADVGLAIGDGEFWAFLGPNGQGKSTLVNAILGQHRPAAGELVLSPALEAGRAIGYVPQRLAELSPLPCTVQEFVAMGLVNQRAARQEAAARTVNALAQVSLTPLAQRDIRRLSGGERQRALVARALVRQPLLLLMDEPTTGLDIVAEHALMECLAALHGSGMAMVLVTHDLAVARRLATHVALVSGGRVRTGAAAPMLTDSMLATLFPEDAPP